MAIFTVPQMIARLTKGFVKMTGREPDGLEKIKIRLEALEKVKQQDKVVDMEGKVIDTSKGIMGGKQIQDSPEFGAKIRETYDAAQGPGKGQEMIDALKSPGAKKSYEILEKQLGVKLYGDETFEEVMEIQRTGKHPRGEPKAEGGRIGYKIGSIDKARRAFLKTMGAAGAGITALKTGLLGFGKGAAGKKAVEQVVTTPSVPGKPEWFDALVNKVILEGDDVTKQFATKEREIVHTKKLEEGKFADEVTVYRDLDDGTIRVEYSSVDNMSEAPVNLTFKPGIADETTRGKPADTFQADEVVPESRMVGPDDFEIEDAVDEFDNVTDLNSDVSKLKQFAGQKLTTKEIVEGINKRKRSRAIVEDRGEAADFMTSRQGDYDPSPDDFASGGIARMLGE